MDLRPRGQDRHRHLRALEDLLIALSAHFGVAGTRREGLTGVWVGEKKIASIGIGVRRWISLHGFALNCDCDLDAYSAIVPCGIPDAGVTSLSAELDRQVSVDEVRTRVAEALCDALDGRLPVSAPAASLP